jgi:hypothetical protein
MSKQSQYKRLMFQAKLLLSSLVLSAAIVPHASAHLMVAQHGTLNFKGDGVFMVLSLPVSAFDAIDDDGDGKMSAGEFIKHRAALVTAINEKVRLTDKEGSRPLQGLMLSPVASHEEPQAPNEQLVIMGRFALASIDSATSDVLTLHVGLFGKAADERSLEMTATRKLGADSAPEKYKFVLTPEQPETSLFTKKP